MSIEFNYLVGLLVASGGLMGYVKSKSVPSLAAGLTFGTLFVVSGYLGAQGQPNAYLLGAGCSLVLLGVMGRKFLKTQKPVPGLVSIIAIVAGYYNYQRLRGIH